MQKAVVADLHEPGRKDVLKETANELECGKAHDFAGSGLGVGITKAHIALVDLDDAGVCNRGAEDVGCEIANAAGACAAREKSSGLFFDMPATRRTATHSPGLPSARCLTARGHKSSMIARKKRARGTTKLAGFWLSNG